MFGNKLEVSMYRYNPEQDDFPYMKKYKIEKPTKDIMVLDCMCVHVFAIVVLC
jgi:succinate dehydrogenase / fumarate reductase iron-sulfur subunit